MGQTALTTGNTGQGRQRLAEGLGSDKAVAKSCNRGQHQAVQLDNGPSTPQRR